MISKPDKLIQADGYPVESYQLPVISKERRALATVLQRTVGFNIDQTDQEVLMFYSDILHPTGAIVL